jgi:hypothetical protein
MSTKIGKVDLKKEILNFLRAYNKSKGKTKKIQKNALERLNRFLNIFVKIIVVNCAEMLAALKLVTLTSAILYTVYDITMHGDKEFTKEVFLRFQNALVREQIEKSDLLFDSKAVLGTKIFDLNAKMIVHKVLNFWGISTNPKSTNCDLLIEFVLLRIFEASGDCEVLTADILAEIGKREEFVKLDECLGSFAILCNDAIDFGEEMEVEA